MWCCYLSFLLVIFLNIPSSYGDLSQCKLNECQPLYPETWLAGRGFLPPYDAPLTDICSPLLEFLDCNLKKLQFCEGTELRNLNGTAQNAIGVIRMHLRKFYIVNSLIVELCNKDSDLHKGYEASIDCIKQITRERDSTCSDAARSLYSTYKAAQSTTEELDEEKSNEMEAVCMISGYTTACAMGRLKQRCGDIASKTTIGILQRLKGTGFADCQEKEGEKLRGQFLDFVATEREGVNLSLFREVFATMKKRK